MKVAIVRYSQIMSEKCPMGHTHCWSARCWTSTPKLLARAKELLAKRHKAYKDASDVAKLIEDEGLTEIVEILAKDEKRKK